MNTAVDIGIELKMSSKKDYTDRFDQKFEAVFDVIDLPNLSLFEIIENVKSLDFSVDPELVSDSRCALNPRKYVVCGKTVSQTSPPCMVAENCQ